MSLSQVPIPLDRASKECYDALVLKRTTMTNDNLEEVVSRCVVDVVARKVHIYSDHGNDRVVECESVDEFMNVLDYVRSHVNEDILFYSDAL